MDSEFLKYGDLILLHSPDFSGYVSSTGFLDTTCVLQEGSDMRQVLSSRSMVFQLLPKLNYGSLIEYQHLKRTFYQKSGGGQMALKQEDLDLIESLQQKMESEAVQGRTKRNVFEGKEGNC